MKKIFRFVLVALAGASLFSCKDALEVTNPSVVDNDFVFSSFETGKTVMLGAYNTYITCNTNSEGFFCNLDNIGSDVERCSVGMIADLVGASQLYGGQLSYAVERFNINFIKGVWGNMYKIISLCNNVIFNIERFSNFDEIVSTAPNDWSDLLGQAYALRATMYYDLVRYFGDVIYIDEAGKNITDLSNRDFIIESELAHLMKVEGYLYSVGENNHLPDQMTRNYVDGLIGRLCFMEAGYQTRRTDLGDDFYTDAEGNVLSFDVWGTDDARNARYARRSDWKDFYQTALPYLEKAVNTPAGVTFTTVDPRSDSEGRVYNNPFQYYFNQVTNQVMADETIYEVSMKENGGGSRIAYNYGRGSNGGSPGYPPKANAQTCTYPQTFYGLYDPQDLRRDATLSVTGSTGGGAEILYNYALSNKVTIGVGMNKYDLNRVANPDARQLYSGINFVVMRQADVILMLAEAYAQTGNEASARTELKKVHDRAFPSDVRDAKFTELLSANDNNVLEAIYAERKLEFVGEGLRRWDLVRTGKFPEVAVEYRAQLIKDAETMETQGYVEFENGNVFPGYVWTKLMDGKKVLGYRLTSQTPSGLDPDSDEYALLVPGWRGQHDSWETVAEEDGNLAKVTAGDNTNLAIMGLFEYIAPGSDRAKELEARGYTMTRWGVEIVSTKDSTPGVPEYDSARKTQWSADFMCGYTDEDYAAKKAPIYLVPMQETVCTTTGLLNGYGFKSTSN